MDMNTKNLIIRPLIAVMLLASMLGSAEAVETIEKILSRFGDVTLTTVINGNDPDDILAQRTYTIALGDKIMYRTKFEGFSSIKIDRTFQINSKDVLLVSFWDGGTHSPMEYLFLQLDKSGFKKSKSFIAPDISVMKVTKSNDKIVINYHYPTKGYNNAIQRPPVIWENGDIKVNDLKSKNK